MKVTIKEVLTLFFLLLVSLLNSGCTDSNLTGDVFVVKGDGDIKPLAGWKVYLLPYKSEAEFLYEIANDTYATIIPETSETVKLLSQSALAFAQEQKENLDKKVASIKGKYSTPPSDCNELESKYKTITQKTAQLTEKHNKLISQLENEINVATSDKDKALRKVADEIDNGLRNKVTVTIISQDGHDIKYTIYNDTAYGIKLKKVVLNYNGIEIEEEEYFSTLHDAYGFDTNMHVMPNTSRTFSGSIILKAIPRNPELKLLYETGKLKGLNSKYSRRGPYPLINKVILKYDLYNISRKRDENKIVYNKTPVNFTDLAIKEESFSSFDNKIERIRQQHATENNKFINDDNIKQKLKTQKELKECQNNYAIFKKDTGNLAELNKNISKLSKVIDALAQPKAEVVNDKWIATAIESIKVLNSDFRGSFELPSLDDKYTELVTYNVAKKLSESTQTDTSIKGAYSFTEVKKGNYLLISEYIDNFVHGFWIKEVALDKDTKIDLNNNSMVDMPLIEYLSIKSKDKILK